MYVKYLQVSTVILSFLLPAPGSVTAFHSGKTVTPYGDYCKHFSHYGRNKAVNTRAEAEQALRHYYSKKGYDIKIVKVKGRFLKVNVKKKGKVVDTVIFDMHTGRLRSVY